MFTVLNVAIHTFSKHLFPLIQLSVNPRICFSNILISLYECSIAVSLPSAGPSSIVKDKHESQVWVNLHGRIIFGRSRGPNWLRVEFTSIKSSRPPAEWGRIVGEMRIFPPFIRGWEALEWCDLMWWWSGWWWEDEARLPPWYCECWVQSSNGILSSFQISTNNSLTKSVGRGPSKPCGPPQSNEYFLPLSYFPSSYTLVRQQFHLGF